VVFDTLVGPAVVKRGYLLPGIGVLEKKRKQFFILLGRPLGFIQFWVQIIVPSLLTLPPSLLKLIRGDLLGDIRPIDVSFILIY
jgi:hypothetical protein